MRLPPARGKHSAAIAHCIAGSTAYPDPWSSDTDILADGDFQLSLWMLYELHYRGFDDAVDDAEWSPRLLEVRKDLEHHLESAIDSEVAQLIDEYATSAAIEVSLQKLIESYDGASLADYLRRNGTADQIREVLAQRSVLQLKEADPYTWAVPRLRGGPKVALVELQFDEYGDGDPDRLHQELYARTLTECGLDAEYGGYVALASPELLALANAPSFFGLHRRLRGAALGHLAAFEATSSIPSRKYAQAMRKAGFSDDAAFYFDEHVEADAVHEHLAIRGICAALVADEPMLARDVLKGAATCLVLDDRFAAALIASWDDSTSGGT